MYALALMAKDCAQLQELAQEEAPADHMVWLPHFLWKSIMKVTALLNRFVLANVLLSVSFAAFAGSGGGIEQGLPDRGYPALAAAKVDGVVALARQEASSLLMKVSARSALTVEGTLPR
jgi:hypothetical protein